MHSMLRIRGLAAILSLVLPGMSACGSDPDLPPAFPRTDFDVVVLDRGRGLGFCPDQGMVLDAEIRRNADGTATFAGEWAAAGDFETDACESGPDFCLVRTPFGPQTLTPAQVTDLQAAIASVDGKRCDDDGIECDPCLVTRVSVDGEAVNGTCCGDVNGGFSGPFDALAEQIDMLAVRNAR